MLVSPPTNPRLTRFGSWSIGENTSSRGEMAPGRESRSEAEKAGDAMVAAGYRGFSRDAVAYGDPARVAEQLSVYPDLGFTDIIIRAMVPW